MHCNNWIFDMDGTLTDSMTVVWEGAPDALLARYGRTPKSDLHKTLLTMGMADGAAYLIREYDLPLKMEDYNDVMWDVITKLYETVELKPGVRELLARLKAEGARMCICSNTWSASAAPCSPVWASMNISTSMWRHRGRSTRAGRMCFSRPLHAWAALTLTGALSVRIPSTPPAPPTTQASASSASPMPPASPMSPSCGRSATSS